MSIVSVFQDIVKDCPKMSNLSKIFLRSFENLAPGFLADLNRVRSGSSLIGASNAGAPKLWHLRSLKY